MFTQARRLLNEESSDLTRWDTEFQLIPAIYEDCYPDMDQKLCDMYILKSCLQQSERITGGVPGSPFVEKLLLWISESSLPENNLPILRGAHDDPDDSSAERVFIRSRLKSYIAVQTLNILLSLSLYERDKLPSGILINLLAFTDASDPWTSQSLAGAALELVHINEIRTSNQDFIIGNVLTDFVRPIFSQFRPTDITSQGRKSINPNLGISHFDGTDKTRMPWKYKTPWTISILRWAIWHASESMVREYWHLFIPAVLTLIDDSSSYFKIQGLVVLSYLLKKTSPSILEQTGLGGLLEETIMPILTYLPNLTPLEESIQLLQSAYPTLFQLSVLRFAGHHKEAEKMRFLDGIMRRGILLGMFQSGEKVRIAEVLLLQMRTLISLMGIHAVKHLKDVIPMLSSILADPFTPTDPKLLLATVRAAQSVILNCWPRVVEPVHRIELIKAFSLCWLNLSRELDQGRSDEANMHIIDEELITTTGLFTRTLAGNKAFTDEIKTITSADPALRGLFVLGDSVSQKDILLDSSE